MRQSSNNYPAPDPNLFGLESKHSVMPNGELRFRLVRKTGAGYVLTLSTEGGWQNGHSHANAMEIYVLERGRALLATADNSDRLLISALKLTVPKIVLPGTPHNLFLGPDAVLHTLKISVEGFEEGDPDWIPDPRLDEPTKGLSAKRLEAAFDSPIHLRL